MSLRNRFFLLVVVVSLVALAACGSGSNHAVPPPGGGFSNSDLNGTYVFSSTGVDAGGIFLAMAGTLQANGNGGITGGMIDVNGLDVGPSSTPITGGSYSVSVDGRGHATLNSSTSLASAITIDFVLSSTSHGLVTEFDGNGTGSGTLDLQVSTSPSGSYSFGLFGASVSAGNEIPFAMAGSFTLNGSNISAGIADIVNDGIATGGTNGLTISAGSVTGGSPGTASVTTAAGTFTFDVYPIDATHIKLIEIDSLPIVAGDAFTQQTSIPAGTLTYTMSGLDNGGGPEVMGGFLGTASNQISAGYEDYNDVGTVGTAAGFGGSYTAASGGRATLTLNSFYNGEGGVVSPTVIFAAYPSSGGVQLLEVDSNGISGGTAFSQSATTVAASQGYGLNLTAFNGGDFEEDDIAEFTLSGTTVTGLADINDEGSTSSPLNPPTFDGTLTADSSVPGHGTVTTNQFDFNYYVVDASTALLIEIDDNQLGLGSFIQQSATQGAVAASLRPAVLHLKPAAKAAWKLRKK